jgi:hypothetical protein
MRVKAAIAGAALAALAVGTAANAAVVATVTPVGTPTVGATVLTGWTGYTVTLTSTTPGSNVTAFDFFNQGGGFFGPMHQQWAREFDEDLEVFTFTPTPKRPHVASNALDSAFLDFVTIAMPDPPTEDNPGTGSPLAHTATRYRGVGTSLTGSFGLDPVSQAQSIDVAYIVVRDGEAVSFFGQGVEGGVAYPVMGVIPEPATMGLLAPLALGLLARRRRNA